MHRNLPRRRGRGGINKQSAIGKIQSRFTRERMMSKVLWRQACHLQNPSQPTRLPLQSSLTNIIVVEQSPW